VCRKGKQRDLDKRKGINLREGAVRGMCDILQSGWNVYREGVPVLPGTLLHRLRPERVTSSPEEAPEYFTNLMQEGGGIEPHRAYTRLTAYKAVSTPNGLRLPYQNADAVRRHRQNLSGPGPTRTGIFGVRTTRSFRLSYGATRVTATWSDVLTSKSNGFMQ
jgi:hypothetical protein